MGARIMDDSAPAPQDTSSEAAAVTDEEAAAVEESKAPASTKEGNNLPEAQQTQPPKQEGSTKAVKGTKMASEGSLTLSPKEIVFAMKENQEVKVTLKLTNSSKVAVGFNIQTSDKELVNAKPNRGLVEAGKTTEITMTHLPLPEVPAKCGAR